jgi:2-keto-4-pentenoate hydratase
MASMRVDDATAVSLGGYRALLGEVEIAFSLARSLPRGAGADPETLRSAVASVHVALDLADLRFDPDAGTPPVGDIIADGVGARRYVLGPPRDSLLLERRTECTLHVDETLVSRAPASDAWGDPWRVLEWVSSRTPLEAGEVVLTGALGSIYQGAKAPLSLVGACSGLGEARVLLC